MARFLRLRKHVALPTNPPPEYADLYLQQDGDLTLREHDGSETTVGAGGGGGNLSVDNGTTTAEVTRLVAHGADVSVPGQATLQVIQRAIVTLGNDDITALPTIPYQLVAGIPGKFLHFMGAVAVLDNTAAVYSGIDEGGTLLEAGVGTALFRAGTGGDWGWLLVDGSAPGVIVIPPFISLLGSPPFVGNSDYLTNLTGQGLFLNATNGASVNLSGGDPGNTLVVTVAYMIVDLPAV